MVLALSLALATLGPPQAQAPKVTPRLGEAANRELDGLRREADPKTNAIVTALLRRYVENTRSRNALDDAIKQRMDAVPGGKAAAKRILARLDAMPKDRKAQAFGGRATTGATTTAQWGAAFAQGAGLIHGGIGTTPPDELMGEWATPPSDYTVKCTGITTTTAADADGADELVVMTSFVRVELGGYVTTTLGLPQTGAIEDLAAGEMIARDDVVYQVEGTQPAALAVTAAFEADGDTTTMREDYVAMLALAEPLAYQAEGETSIEDYAFALDYTLGLLHLSDATHWPSGTLTRTVLAGDTSLYELWGTSAQKTGAVPWKLKHDHSIGGATYSIFFDVPAPPLVMPKVTVQISKVESLDGVDDIDEDDLHISVSIGNETGYRELAEDDDTPSVSWGVKRKIKLEPRPITIRVWDFSPGEHHGYNEFYGGYDYCGNWGPGKLYPPCPSKETSLVIDGASKTQLNLVYDPVTKKITGDATGNAGDAITVQGTGGKRVKVRLRISHVN